MPSNDATTGLSCRRLARFALEKWYLDVITEGGDVLIGYASELNWGKASLRHASTLFARGDAPVRVRQAVRGAALPVQTSARTTWTVPRLRTTMTHRPLCDPVHAVLLSQTEGSVDWTCCMPWANVVANHDGRRLTGFGYVERLQLGIRPWRLPIEELRWGRAISKRCAVTWIDWRGAEHTERLVAVNGTKIDAEIDDDGVIAEGRRLVRLGDRRILRNGSLGRAALAGLPRALHRVLPKRLLAVEECKWVGHASVAGTRGHAIWEVVRWP